MAEYYDATQARSGTASRIIIGGSLLTAVGVAIFVGMSLTGGTSAAQAPVVASPMSEDAFTYSCLQQRSEASTERPILLHAECVVSYHEYLYSEFSVPLGDEFMARCSKVVNDATSLAQTEMGMSLEEGEAWSEELCSDRRDEIISRH